MASDGCISDLTSEDFRTSSSKLLNFPPDKFILPGWSKDILGVKLLVTVVVGEQTECSIFFFAAADFLLAHFEVGVLTELSFLYPKLDNVRGDLYSFESLRDTGSMSFSSDVLGADLDDMVSPQIPAEALETSVDSLWDLTSGTTVGVGSDSIVSSSQIFLASLLAFSVLSSGGGIILFCS